MNMWLVTVIALTASIAVLGVPIEDVDDKVINGQDVRELGIYPWHTALAGFNRYYDRDGKNYENKTYYVGCGGTVIDKSWILTAAHCVNMAKIGQHVITGAVNVAKIDGKAQVRKIKQVIEHPEHDQKDHLNDIALIQLDKPLKFDRYTSAARLPTKDYKFNKKMGVLTGWGDTDNAEKDANKILQAGIMQIKSHEDCKEEIPYMYHSPTTICAGSTKENEASACPGDSGGPLVTDYKTKDPVVVGVVSFGMPCTSFPAEYTNVQMYLSWIQKTMKENA